MPLAFRIPQTLVPAEQLAAAAGITADTGADYQLQDAYGITYRGNPAHLTLSALARPDLTPTLCHGNREHERLIRTRAMLLIGWFTSPHIPAAHAHAFARFSPTRVCELVAYLAAVGEDEALQRVGVDSLRFYTEHLALHPVPNPAHPFPQVVDALPVRSAIEISDDGPAGHRLQVSASAADGAAEVAVRVEVRAEAAFSWQFVTALPLPVDQVNARLLDGGEGLIDLLTDHPELIAEHTAYIHSDEGRVVTAAHVQAPGTPLTPPDTGGGCHAWVALFFVGPDQARALATAPFTDLQAARRAAGPGESVFTTRTAIHSDDLRRSSATGPTWPANQGPVA